MKNPLRRFLTGTSFALVGLTGLSIVFVLYPNNLFAERITHKEFNIYSDTEVKGDYQAILGRATALVKTSELYDGEYRYDIFLTSGTTYKTISFKLLGPALARSLDNNIMLNVHADFEKDLLTGPENKRELARTIAHEMVHCLQMNKYGIWKFNPANHPPLWKLEGYPEYIAYQDEINAPGYSFTETVRKLREFEERSMRWIEMKPGHSDPIIYFKGRIMVEYLMDVKGMTYDQILSEQVQDEEVRMELINWYEKFN